MALRKRKTVKAVKAKNAEIDPSMNRPDIVEGSEKEESRAKKVKSNEQKVAKTKRGLGQDYISRKTKETAPPKQTR